MNYLPVVGQAFKVSHVASKFDGQRVHFINSSIRNGIIYLVNRLALVSVTFGLTRQVVSKRESLPHQAGSEAVERETRLELATTCLEGRDSTN